MYAEIYIDVVFLTNFLVDYLLLRLVGWMFKCRGGRGRYLLAAASGALFSCLILYVPTETYHPAAAVLLHGGCALFMLRMGCGLKKGGLLMGAMVTLYLAAFLCGGFWEVVSAGGAITLKTFVMSAVIAYLGITALLFLSDTFRARWKNVYPVTLSYQGKVQSSYGLYDTGCLLTDPVDGGPVSIVEPDVLEALLSGELVEKLRHLKENPGELKSTEIAGMHPHFLSCRTVGDESVLLLAVTLEDLIIHTPGEAVHIPDPVFALSLEPSALGNEYKILLNSRLLH